MKRNNFVISAISRLFLSIMVVSATCTLSGCSDDEPEVVSPDPEPDPTPEPDPNSGGTEEVTIESIMASRMLDVVFNEDGTAVDVSDWGITVDNVTGNSVMTYYNSAIGLTVPRFFNEPGEDVESGYYAADYKTDRYFKAALQDGFTMEVLFMLDTEPNGSKMSMFSSMESTGGMGLFVGDNNYMKQIGFEFGVTSNSSVKTTTLLSGVVPERGKYYHVVAVWNNDESTAYLFVNGERKAAVAVSGELALPVTAYQWFGIGADSGNKGENAWRGDVVLARVYDDPLTADGVKLLWNEADKDFDSVAISVDDPMLFSNCEVCGGYDYMILGYGYESGDNIKMTKRSNSSQTYTLSGTATIGHISITLPDDISEGTYNFYLVRGEGECPLGTARFVLGEDPQPLAPTEIIAHRGYHLSAPENSRASLRLAQELGVAYSETDVWITTDGYLVISHDGTYAGRVFQNLTYDEISDITLSNGEKLPLLSDYLDVLAENTDTKLVIEVKEHSTAERNTWCVDEVIKTVKEKGMEDYVKYLSFDRDVCRKFAAETDNLVGYLINGTMEPSELAEEGIMSIDPALNVATNDRSIVKKAHNENMTVNVWTVDTDTEMMTSIALGVDYITTDYPDRLLEIFKMMEE